MVEEYALKEFAKFTRVPRVWFFFLILFFGCSVLLGQKSEWDSLDYFFESLLKYDFKGVEHTLGNTSSPYKESLELLSETIYWAGQSTQLKDIEIAELDYDEDSFHQSISFLAQGYGALYSNSYKADAFQRMYKSYEIAKNLNYKPLIRATLMGLMEVYHYEFIQSNKQHLIYLKEFDALSENIFHRYWLNIYRIYFFTQSLNIKERNVYNYVLELDEIVEDLGPNDKLLSNYYSLKAVQLEIKHNYDLAEKYHHDAILISDTVPYLEYITFRSLIRLSEIANKKNDFNQALKYIKQAKSYKDDSDTLRANFYINRFSAKNLYFQSNYKEAYERESQATQIQYELDYFKNSLELSQLNVLYETEKKEKQILEEQQKVRTNRNWLIAAGLALLFVAGIAILFQKNTTKKRLLAEQEALLKQQRVDNLLKAQELVSIDAMIEGQEKERQRVANELHDDLGSLMATVKLHFDKAKNSKTDPALQHAQKLLEEAYQKVRSIAHSKNSGVMSDQGLLPAIKKMATVISETNALQVTVEDFGMGERLENSLELTLFRMVQELVANAIKHAEANKVTIQLTQHEDNLNIIVEDNGKGFERSQVDTSDMGMGLTTIEKRVEHLEGNFTVDSILGKGTSILIDIPI